MDALHDLVGAVLITGLRSSHGPILCYKQTTDELENLEAQGIPLGIIAGIGYEESLVRRLAPNDMIVLVTGWLLRMGESRR